jgi:hypothetical protein
MSSQIALRVHFSVLAEGASICGFRLGRPPTKSSNPSVLRAPVDAAARRRTAGCGNARAAGLRAAVALGMSTYARGVSYTNDPRVDAYIDGLPQWQQAICQRVRDLVHAADSQVEETIKRRVQPYFVLEGNICALLAAQDHVNVFLYDGGIVPDPERIITGGHDNQTARTVAIYENQPINESALAAMFRQIIADNRVGGWRKLKTDPPNR